MTDKSKPKAGKSKPKVERLELSKETVQDLTESEAEAARGAVKKTRTGFPCLCRSAECLTNKGGPGSCTCPRLCAAKP